MPPPKHWLMCTADEYLNYYNGGAASRPGHSRFGTIKLRIFVSRHEKLLIIKKSNKWDVPKVNLEAGDPRNTAIFKHALEQLTADGIPTDIIRDLQFMELGRTQPVMHAALSKHPLIPGELTFSVVLTTKRDVNYEGVFQWYSNPVAPDCRMQWAEWENNTVVCASRPGDRVELELKDLINALQRASESCKNWLEQHLADGLMDMVCYQMLYALIVTKAHVEGRTGIGSGLIIAKQTSSADTYGLVSTTKEEAETP